MMFKEDILLPEKEEMKLICLEIWAATTTSICLKAGPNGKQSGGGGQVLTAPYSSLVIP